MTSRIGRGGPRRAPAPDPSALPVPVPALARPAPGSAIAVRELVTVRDALRYACSRFGAAGLAYGHGTDNAWDEAAWLVLWSLHLPPERLEPVLDARLTTDERSFVFELVDRRCHERVPVAYHTGEAWLRGVRFKSDARALVPRSLIAEAMEESLDAWLPDGEPEAVLDLCTGGGSLAVLAALRWPQARVDASDVSAPALALARENLALHGLEGRITLHHGDLYAPLGRRRYDLILTNPPYVNAGSMAALPAEFRAEPASALAGGADGMAIVARILARGARHLSPRGLMLVEIGHEAAHFEAAFPGLEFTYVPVTAGDDQLVLVGREALERAFEP